MSLFSKIAHRYDKIVGHFNLEEIMDYMNLHSDELLFDLGGGTGRIAYQLAKHVNSCLVLDASYKMLLQAKKKGNDLLLIQGFSESLPIKGQSLKQIFLNDSLHHIRMQKETLEECFRVLSFGGQLIIREFDKKYFWNKFLIFGEKILRFKSKFLTPTQLSEMCQKIGFETSWKRPSKATFILIAKKP
ncbi:MAG: methyltransferase domain-containing protein [Candidatus Heimdallarchaeota archaeon]|nr:methyltransferase domain-containing protein [Candidatus Heimdallarchaeota archaeon]